MPIIGVLKPYLGPLGLNCVFKMVMELDQVVSNKGEYNSDDGLDLLHYYYSHYLRIYSRASLLQNRTFGRIQNLICLDKSTVGLGWFQTCLDEFFFYTYLCTNFTYLIRWCIEQVNAYKNKR